MQGSPGKTIAIIVVVVLAAGVAIWSVMNFTKGPQGHINLTPEQMIEMERKNRGR